MYPLIQTASCAPLSALNKVEINSESHTLFVGKFKLNQIKYRLFATLQN